MRDKIWYELVNTKYGDEYLCYYISSQQGTRKWFKISTLLLSAGGIFSAFRELKIPTIISLIGIGVVQLATMVESYVIHTEKDIDDLAKLRILYYEKCNQLEKLFINLENFKGTEASDHFFTIRENSKEIETLATRLHIKQRRKLMQKADINTRNYLITYYE